MNEIKMHTTIYWEVPKGADPKVYMELLQRLPKEDALKLATDFADSDYEVNE